ncbi:hepatitis A virus cellular receptor 1 homolog isoform X2 [Mus caroli]|uniref:Hepatitis A virus cellular receptor 1 homolog isoform X2 n=1 Tax=Mus caroli TaxID=10089 RepID=A0A6P7RJG5_MUSCR|nr:hepatitis A virus cellular receptor 1 homolog isoform X2 [Mus caroli]
MNQLQVFISGLIFLLPGAVDSYVEVKGVVGHPVTLPCTYSTYRGITTTCWGRGQCPSSACQNTLIWTNGHRVTYRKSSRYNLKGHISEGDVSLTIENSVVSDSGLYCCRVEIPGWFNDQKVTFSLQVKPEPTTFCPHETTAEVTGTPSHTPTDWNGTVTSSGDTWNNHTEAILPGKPQKNPTKGFYVGICIAALLLLLLVSTVAITRYILMKRKSAFLSVVAFRVSKIEALQNAAVVHSRAEDNIYIVEDRP